MSFDESLQKFVLRVIPKEITPNQLTFLRILLVLPTILFLVLEKYQLALLTFFLGAILDLLDGPLARARNQTSDFGKILDPLGDKVLFVSTLLIIGFEIFPKFLIWGIIIIELSLALLAIFQPLFAKIHINRQLGANIFGKIKMWFESSAIIILLFNPKYWFCLKFSEILLYFSFFFAFLSLIGHIFGIFRKEKKEEK